MRSFFIALRFLTIFPWPKTLPEPEEIGKSAACFPLVGLILGLILILCDRLLYHYMESTLISILLITLLILVTRGLHLDGLGDTFDGLGARGGPKEALAAMRDSHVGTFGLLAIVIVLAFKIHAVAVMQAYPGLLLAPAFGRWAMVLMAYGSQPARSGLGQIMVESVRGIHIVLATVLTLAAATFFAGHLGLWIALGVSLFALVSRNYFHRRLGGVTGDTFGAIGEITETLSLVIFAST